MHEIWPISDPVTQAQCLPYGATMRPLVTTLLLPPVELHLVYLISVYCKVLLVAKVSFSSFVPNMRNL